MLSIRASLDGTRTILVTFFHNFIHGLVFSNISQVFNRALPVFPTINYVNLDLSCFIFCIAVLFYSYV